MSDIWRHPAVGTTRSYVYTGEEELDYDQWADAMAAGRAFVTSGPILSLDVSGKGMGEELKVSKGDVLEVSATARSIFDMDRIEIIQNGKVVHTVQASGEKTLEVDLEVSVESSGWIAVRVLGPTQHGAMDSYLFAHTNPVYVIADEEPIQSRSDAAFFVRWIDETIDDMRGMDRWDDPAHKEQVISTFEQGRRLYQAQIEELDRSQPGFKR